MVSTLSKLIHTKNIHVGNIYLKRNQEYNVGNRFKI